MTGFFLYSKYSNAVALLLLVGNVPRWGVAKVDSLLPRILKVASQ